MKKIKCSKKGESTYCRKGQVLIHVWWGKKDGRVILILHITKFVETEKKNRQGEKMKSPEKTEDYSKFTRGVGRTEQVLHYYPTWRWTVKRAKKLVFFLLLMAAPKSSMMLNTPQAKIKRQRLCFQVLHTWLCPENDRDRTRGKQRRPWISSLDSNSTDRTATKTSASEGKKLIYFMFHQWQN